MSTPKTIIAEALDDFNVEDFVDPDFNANAADKIIADLEDAGFRIVAAASQQHSAKGE